MQVKNAMLHGLNTKTDAANKVGWSLALLLLIYACILSFNVCLYRHGNTLKQSTQISNNSRLINCIYNYNGIPRGLV